MIRLSSWWRLRFPLVFVICIAIGACSGYDGSGVYSLDKSNTSVNAISSAYYPMVDTGQIECYDSNGNLIDCTGSGHDGGYSSAQPKLVNNGDGIVTDHVTGLMRQADSGSTTN